MKRYWNKFLNWLIPSRRGRLLAEIIKQDQELGLYDETFNTKREMKTLLWLDDVRDPNTNNWLVFSPIESPYKVYWVKDYREFVDWITSNGLPSAICFDHDLGDIDELTGYDAAKWLVDYCIDNNKELPKYNIQSANPVGKDNINGLLNNFRLTFKTKER